MALAALPEQLADLLGVISVALPLACDVSPRC